MKNERKMCQKNGEGKKTEWNFSFKDETNGWGLGKHVLALFFFLQFLRFTSNWCYMERSSSHFSYKFNLSILTFFMHIKAIEAIDLKFFLLRENNRLSSYSRLKWQKWLLVFIILSVSQCMNDLGSQILSI